MNWSVMSPEELEKQWDRISERLRSPEPREREAALMELPGLRKDEAIRAAVKAGGDPEERVRTVARDVRRLIENDVSWFGSGQLLRMEIPPRLLSLEEEERATQQMWLLWGLGGFLTVSTLLVREHTGLYVVPVIAVFVMTLGLFYFTRRLRKDPPSPGWVFFDIAKQEVLVEIAAADGGLTRHSVAFSGVRAARYERENRANGPEEPEVFVYHLHLDLMDGRSFLLARRDSLGELKQVAHRLHDLTGMAIGERSMG